MVNKPACKRIGITMRKGDADTYPESRDILAHDWASYMKFSLPEVIWMPVPNLGNNVIAYVDGWQLDGLILSGGNDIGESPVRDETELLLLRHFIESGKPVLGICRGLQLLHKYMGGDLIRCDEKVHVAAEHKVAIHRDILTTNWNAERRINSFHKYGISLSELKPPLKVLATTSDGWVEAARLDDEPVIGLMWHPEREKEYSQCDRSLVRSLFGYESRDIIEVTV